MKKIYVTPLNKVRDLSTQEGILLVASGMEGKNFDTETSLTDQGAGEERSIGLAAAGGEPGGAENQAGAHPVADQRHCRSIEPTQ